MATKSSSFTTRTPEADGPLLTWGEIVSRPTPGHGAIVGADLYTGRSDAATQSLSFTALEACHRVEEDTLMM